LSLTFGLCGLKTRSEFCVVMVLYETCYGDIDRSPVYFVKASLFSSEEENI